MTNKTKLIIALFISGLFFFSSSFAQEEKKEEKSCQTCFTPSPVFQNYVDMVYDILQAIDTVAEGKKQYGIQTQPGLFQGGVLPLENSNPIDKSLVTLSNNVNTHIQSLTTSAILISKNIVNLPSEVIKGGWLIKSNKYIQRDMLTLYDLDKVIADQMIQLGESGRYFSEINNETHEAIERVAEKYNSTLVNELNISSSARYQNVIDFLQKTQNKMKSMVSLGNKKAFLHSTDDSPKLIQTTNGKIQAQFKKKEILQMKEDYKCARGVNSCNNNIKEFGQFIENTREKQREKSNQSIDIFRDSITRLGLIFRKDANALKDRQDKQNDPKNATNQKKQQRLERKQEVAQSYLMRKHEASTSLYSLDGEDIDKQEKEHLNFTGRVKREIDINLKGSLVNFVSEKKDIFSENQKDEEEKTKDKTDQELKAKTDIYHLPNDLQQLLNQEMNLLIEQAQKSKETAVLQDPLVVTKKIKDLTTSVENIIRKIGGKDTKKSIIHNLGIACEQQCSNVGGNCRGG